MWHVLRFMAGLPSGTFSRIMLHYRRKGHHRNVSARLPHFLCPFGRQIYHQSSIYESIWDSSFGNLWVCMIYSTSCNTCGQHTWALHYSDTYSAEVCVSKLSLLMMFSWTLWTHSTDKYIQSLHQQHSSSTINTPTYKHYTLIYTHLSILSS